MKNPRWKEEELILALNLYMNHDLKWLNGASEKTDEIVEMSNILRNLDLYSDEVKSIPNFRSPSSVHMKLMNFKGLDPKYGKYGLRNASNLDREIWTKYSNDMSRLKYNASQIYKDHYLEQKNMDLMNVEENIKFKIKTCLNYLKQYNELCIQIRKDAIKLLDIDLSQQTIDCMYNQTISSTENIKLLGKLVHEFNKPKDDSEKKQNSSYENTEKKIGEYVKETFQNLINKNKLSDLDIDNLLNAEWSRKTFNIGHPFLKKLQNNIPVRIQVKVGKYQRYWKRVYKVFGTDYIICKEWYDSNRKAYNSWLKKFNESDSIICSQTYEFKEIDGNRILFPIKYKSLTINKNIFLNILNAIKKFDQEGICVETSELIEYIEEKIIPDSNYKIIYEMLSTIIAYLRDTKIIMPFKNSKSDKYVIEDYDLLSDLINYLKNVKGDV